MTKLEEEEEIIESDNKFGNLSLFQIKYDDRDFIEFIIDGQTSYY